jgi:hypothetical protein
MAAAFSVVPASGGRHVLKMNTKILKATAVIKWAAGFLALAAFPAFAQDATNRFHALVLAERGDQHEAFVVAALEWLKGMEARDHFAMDIVENPNQFNKAFLARYQVLIQLNYPPYRWSARRIKADGWKIIFCIVGITGFNYLAGKVWLPAGGEKFLGDSTAFFHSGEMRRQNTINVFGANPK